jgi:hypothetical protein
MAGAAACPTGPNAEPVDDKIRHFLVEGDRLT